MKHTMKAYANRIMNDQPSLSFEIICDLHIATPLHNKKLDNALEDIWQRKIRNVAVLGDLCSHGLMFQLNQCLKQLKEFPNRYLIVLGNHDTYSMQHKDELHIHPLYKELVLSNHHHIYYDEMIDGYHFYVLNSEKPCKSNAYYSRQQLFWLKEHLEADSDEKPVFILCHHPFKDSHIHSDEKELSMGFLHEDLLKIVKSHPNVIFFSGHIHNSYETCAIRCDNTLFQIDVPSFSQTMFGVKKEETGYQVQVYHDFLYIRCRDYKNHEWILSGEHIVDFKTHQSYSFDGSLAQAPR